MVQKFKHLKQPGLGITVPPKIEFVHIYFMQKGLSQKQADFFFNHFEDRKWIGVDGIAIKNWKTLASEWVWEILHPC